MKTVFQTLLAQAEAADGGNDSSIVALLVIVLGGLFIFFGIIVIAVYGKLWFRAYMSNARVSMLSLIGMTFRQVNARVIVEAKIMAMQAGIGAHPDTGITTSRLEAHYLANGNVPSVIHAIISAHRAFPGRFGCVPPNSSHVSRPAVIRWATSRARWIVETS